VCFNHANYVTSWQVSPAEIESVLLKHPYIADVAVIGVKRRDLKNGGQVEDELVRAFVVRRKTAAGGIENLSAENVYQFARSQLVSYKSITGGIVFVEEIPRTPSGKIQRFKLVEMNAYRELVAGLLGQQGRAIQPMENNLGLARPPGELLS
jgi:acyl-coenzyme A synthetase/AMP-(fatty) acid ligase